MTYEEFKELALQVLLDQRFGDLPLFEAEDLEDFEVCDEVGGIELELFLEQLYEVLK